MNQGNEANSQSKTSIKKEDEQYSLAKIIVIWALATAPMAFFAYFVTPAVIKYFNIPSSIPAFLVFWPFMILGLIWQFVLSLIIVHKECGDIKWQTIKKRMQYNKPSNPKTGKYSYKLFWWVIPFIAFSYLSQYIPLPDISSVLPFINDLPQYNLQQVISPEYKGAWWLLGLTLITIPFNYFLGEEFLFRGILLPKMRGVFGKWDWFVNGVFFGFYHLHKPLGILHQIIFSGVILSLPYKLFRSNWLAVIIHGSEAIVALVIICQIILG